MVDAVVTEEILARARAGDGDTFRELTESYRRELQLQCYPIFGLLQDAEDLLQEATLAECANTGTSLKRLPTLAEVANFHLGWYLPGSHQHIAADPRDCDLEAFCPMKTAYCGSSTRTVPVISEKV